MRRAAAFAALTVVVARGCASIPTGGAVHLGHSVASGADAADVSLRFLPPQARSGQLPNDVVQGFLHAMVSEDGNYEIARTYLTMHAAAAWDPGGRVTTYDDAAVKVLPTSTGSPTRTLQLRAPRIGFIDGRGEYTPSSGELRASFTLVRQRGQWRISR